MIPDESSTLASWNFPQRLKYLPEMYRRWPLEFSSTLKMAAIFFLPVELFEETTNDEAQQ